MIRSFISQRLGNYNSVNFVRNASVGNVVSNKIQLVVSDKSVRSATINLLSKFNSSTNCIKAHENIEIYPNSLNEYHKIIDECSALEKVSVSTESIKPKDIYQDDRIIIETKNNVQDEFLKRLIPVLDEFDVYQEGARRIVCTKRPQDVHKLQNLLFFNGYVLDGHPITVRSYHYPLFRNRNFIRTINKLQSGCVDSIENTFSMNKMFEKYIFHSVEHAQDVTYYTVSDECYYEWLLKTRVSLDGRFIFLEPAYQSTLAVNHELDINEKIVRVVLKANSSITMTALTQFLDSTKAEAVYFTSSLGGIKVLDCIYSNPKLAQKIRFLNGSYLSSERVDMRYCPLNKHMIYEIPHKEPHQEDDAIAVNRPQHQILNTDLLFSFVYPFVMSPFFRKDKWSNPNIKIVKSNGLHEFMSFTSQEALFEFVIKYSHIFNSIVLPRFPRYSTSGVISTTSLLLSPIPSKTPAKFHENFTPSVWNPNYHTLIKCSKKGEIFKFYTECIQTSSELFLFELLPFHKETSYFEISKESGISFADFRELIYFPSMKYVDDRETATSLCVYIEVQNLDQLELCLERHLTEFQSSSPSSAIADTSKGSFLARFNPGNDVKTLVGKQATN